MIYLGIPEPSPSPPRWTAGERGYEITYPIRQKYGTDIEKNAVHGSDAADTAKAEIASFFTGASLVLTGASLA